MTALYDDIINLPHHVSTIHPQMPRENRAAQFMPFAALTGYDAAIMETARLTDARLEFAENAGLDMKLCILTDEIETHPELSVTFFQPDEKKAGGQYITATGMLKKIDEYEREILLADGRRIAIKDILEIECELFKDLSYSILI